MGRRWNELVVPAVTLVVAFAYWLQVRGQARTVVMVPLGAIVLLAVLCLALLWREVRKQPHHDVASQAMSPPLPSDPSGALHQLGFAWVGRYRREIGLVVLCCGYYLAFERIGFHLANILFLWLTFLNCGVRWTQAVVYGALTTAALYLFTELVKLNVPTAPWL